MSSFLADLRFALRGFRRAPAFALVALATLAIGIGANTAIFSVVDGVVLRPLPYPGGDRLVLVEQVRPDGAASNLSNPDFIDLRDARSLAGVAGWHGDSVVLRGAGPRPERLNAHAVTANYLDVLGTPPALGRGFAPGEDAEGKNRVAVLTWATFQKHFGGDPAAVGRTVTIDDQPFTVIGVLARDFRIVTDDDIELLVPKPRSFDRELAQVRGARFVSAVARLAPGVTLEQAQAELSSVAARLAAAYPDTNTGRGLRVTAMQERLTRDLRPALLILLCAVGFVLLISCANVANLLLARASVRHRELAIRIALGAGRGRIVRQLLVESLLLALTGGALGVLLAVWGLDALRDLIPAELARFQTIAVDARVLAFTLGVSLLTGVAFGLWPALSAARSSPGDALKDAGTRATPHAGRQRARSILVAAEIALATLLLVGAALMLRSFQRVHQVDPGFRAEDLTAGAVVVPTTRYDTDEKLADFYRRLDEQLDALPGVISASIGAPQPYSGMNMSYAFEIVGAPPLPPGQRNVATHHLVSRDWFETLGIPVRAGRTFSAAEDRRGGPPVIVVNQALARAFFGGASPVGKRLALGRAETRVEREIVGVVGDVRGGSLEEAPAPAMYVPFPQDPWFVFGFVLRTRATTGLAASLQAAVAAVDRDQPLGEVTTVERMMSDTLATRRLNTLLLSLFGGIAMLLALIGVYGVMSYTVTQRIPEIGIRMALGARPADVTRMVVGHGLLLAAAGVAAGLVAAVALGRLVASMLFGTSPTDPAVLAAIAAVLLIIAALASWLPARRAAKVDPMIALRSE